MNLNKGKKTILVLVAIFSIIMVAIGATYAFFSFTQVGSTENTISAGTIKFHYDETTHKGAGITLNDALPVNSNQSAPYSGSNYFDFNITAQTSPTPISYVVTAKLDDNSDDIGEIVDLYLTEVNGANESDVSTEFRYAHLYNNLIQYRNKPATEKVIYAETIPGNTANYDKDFRLRMWVDQYADFSGRETTVYKCDGTVVNQSAYDSCAGTKSTEIVMEYPYNDKTFKLTINVYTETNITGYTPVSGSDDTLTSLSMNGCTFTETFDPELIDQSALPFKTYTYTCTGLTGPIDKAAFDANPTAYINYAVSNPNAVVEPTWYTVSGGSTTTYGVFVRVTSADRSTFRTYSIEYYTGTGE